MIAIINTSQINQIGLCCKSIKPSPELNIVTRNKLTKENSSIAKIGIITIPISKRKIFFMSFLSILHHS